MNRRGRGIRQVSSQSPAERESWSRVERPDPGGLFPAPARAACGRAPTERGERRSREGIRKNLACSPAKWARHLTVRALV